MVLKDVREFLVEIGNGWRESQEIAACVAKRFSCAYEIVERDFSFLVGELFSQGYVDAVSREKDDWVLPEKCSSEDPRTPVAANDAGDDHEGSLLDGFCKRHRIASQFHLDLTNACTERCVHCYVPKERHDFLPYVLVDKALHEFRSANGLTVHLTGGECMLHPDFERICRLCVELSLNIIIFTNLTCCDAERLAFLKEIDPQFLNVSLYSMEASEHDAVTQLNGSWGRTMTALKACCAAGVHCRIATPLLRQNQKAFCQLQDFADHMRLHLIPSIDIVAQSDHECANLSSACTQEELKAVLLSNKELFDQGWSGSMPACEAKVCEIGVSRLYLNAKGHYYPCDSMHEYVLGDARTQTFSEIWQGEKLNYLRGLRNADFAACAICQKRPFCKVCPAAHYNATGDIFKIPAGQCAQAAVIKEIYGGGM